MTTQEFKEQNPPLKHLEGEALWNAMEDSLFTQGKAGALKAFSTPPDMEQDNDVPKLLFMLPKGAVSDEELAAIPDVKYLPE